MSQFQLNAQPRQETGKGANNRLRRSGLIPAILYGGSNKAVSLTLNPEELFRCLSTDAGLNNLIHLKVSGGSGGKTVLVKDLQIDSIRRSYVHADLIEVDASQEVRVKVQVVLTGKAAGIQAGGIMQQARRDLEVYARADSIPKEIEADISALEIGDSLHLNDIQLPDGVRSALRSNVTLAACVAPAAEEEPTAVAAAEGAEGEVAAAEGEPEGGEKPAEGAEAKKKE